MAISDTVLGASYRTFFLIQKVLATGNSLIVIISFGPQHVDAFLLRLEILVQIEGYVPQSSQFVVLRVLDVFLFRN